jgi:hypothetical protein
MSDDVNRYVQVTVLSHGKKKGGNTIHIVAGLAIYES